ncbi:MAG: hypothetical protein ABUS79_06220 [Pseudomonadota bacterium]
MKRWMVMLLFMVLLGAPAARAGGLCGPAGCDEGGFCVADPTIEECGTVFCGTFIDNCGNTANCGACTAAGDVCVAGPQLCCAPGQVVGHSPVGQSFCCTPRPNSCALDGVACGPVFDTFCGAELDCGSCPTGFTGGSGQCVANPPRVPASAPWGMPLLAASMPGLGGFRMYMRKRCNR